MLKEILKKGARADLYIYATRVCLGFVIGYTLFHRIPTHELYWTLLSIILVISPEEQDSKKLAVERFRSNFIGSSVGLLCFFIHPLNIYVIVFGIIVSAVFCYLFDLIAVVRTSIVALIIVLVPQFGEPSYWTSIERFACVTLGCLIGVVVTLLTGRLINYYRRAHIYSKRRRRRKYYKSISDE